MMKDNQTVAVRNRNNGSTGYFLPESNIRRSFSPQETKNIPLSELKALQYAPGGDYILRHLLIVESQEALNELNLAVQPEYFYTENEIRKLLLENDNMDAFLDFLDFASDGAIELAKDIAVKEELPDSRKREAITERTGFSIDNAIRVNKVTASAGEAKPKEAVKERRVKPEAVKAETTPARRTAVPEYKVVEK